MADKKSTLKPSKIEKQISAMDTLAQKILSSVDPSYQERLALSRKDSRIQQILADEINFSSGVSRGSIVDFISSLQTTTQKTKGLPTEDIDGTSLFRDVGDIYEYFQQLYKNRYLEISDLKFIARFIPGVGEAVNTTLSAIVGADDIRNSVSRNLVLGSNLTDAEQAQIIAEIERIEKDEKLLKKLKNVVYKKTLITGNYYVYHIPYSELFSQYDLMVKSGKIDPDALIHDSILRSKVKQKNSPGDKNAKAGFNLNNPANESYLEGAIGSDIALEDYCAEVIESSSYLSKEEKNIAKANILNANLGKITVLDSPYLVDALESAVDASSMGDMRTSPYYAAYYGGTAEVVDTEGTVDRSGSRRSARPAKFGVSGTYIKYIDAKNIIPIRIYNTVVGYYYIHSQASAKKARREAMQKSTNTGNPLSSITQNVFSSTQMTEKKKDQIMTEIIDVIADGIISSFSTKFVSKYAEHKKLIADCIISNGLVDNNYSIQFIPREYITPFVINEDENGNGESMIANSLFPAKMLLSLVVGKLLNYMNKSGNKTIAYVGKGPIGVQGANHTQRVIRMLQEGDIVFNDLLSTNLIFSKINRNGTLVIPQDKNGKRLVEFEVQEGQQVDLKTDMEEWLEKLAILGTGVPSAIMEFVDAVDYSKSLVTANIKHAEKCAGYQSDLEEPTTELYKYLIMGSTLSDDLKKKAVNSFEFKLPRPKVLSNANVADFIDTLERSAETIATVWLAAADGEEQNNPDLPKIKAQLKKNYIIRNAPFLDVEGLQQD